MYKRPGVITLLAVLDFFVGVVILVFLALIVATEPEFTEWIFLTAYGLLAVLKLLSGNGLWHLKKYGRILQLAFDAVALLGIPFLTVMSIIEMRLLNQRSFKLLFSGKLPEQLSSEESALIHETTDKKHSKTTIVLAVLYCLFILQIIAMIMVPGIIGPAQRSKQKRTQSDLRTISTLVESYAIDHNNTYPDVNTIDELARILVPEYTKELPLKDGWKNEFRYFTWKEKPDSPGTDSFIVASPGDDGKWEKNDLRDYIARATHLYNNDIVIKNGIFVQYPEGSQH